MASAAPIQAAPPPRIPSRPPAVGPSAGAAMTAEIALIAAVLLAACGHILIKHGLNTMPALAQASIAERLLAYLLTPLVIGGLAVYGTGTLLWIVAVAKRDISYLFPVTSLNYVVITLAGMWLFGEPVSFKRWIGILIVMLGVASLMRSSAVERKA